MSNSAIPQVDRFFTGAEARYDRWRTLLQLTREWETAASKRTAEDAIRTKASASFGDLRQWEDFYAYPGPVLLNMLNERISSGDASGTSRLTRMISAAIVTRSYRTNVGDWEKEEDSLVNVADRFTISGDQKVAHRPYFEVLFASPARQAMWRELGQDLRRLRRPLDKFVYESVFVGSFEDAIL